MTHDLDAHEPAYDEDFPHALDNRLILAWYPQRVLRFARGESLLELGLGHGIATPLFARRFKRHLIVEGSPRMIERFREHNPGDHPEIRLSLFEEFETEERFDTILMGFVLEHVEDPLSLLLRYRRFLSPGGQVFLAVPNGETLHRRLGREAGLLDDLMALGDADRLLGHRRLFSLSGLRALARDAGLREVRCEGLFLKPFTTAQIQSLRLPEPVLQAMLAVGAGYPELCAGILMEAEEEPCGS